MVSREPFVTNITLQGCVSGISAVMDCLSELEYFCSGKVQTMNLK